MGNTKSRTENSLKNMVSGVVLFAISTLLQFVNRKIFLRFLSISYLGVNGLFSNVISMLNIAELGIAGAMVFALYKPLNDNNEAEIKSIMLLYKKLYRFVGGFVLLAGTVLIPFVKLLISDVDALQIDHLQLYFALYVIDAGFSYFLSYKRSIIICNQEYYIVNTTSILKIFFTNIVQIVVLVIFKNYFLYLVIKLLFTISENLLISYIADKKYPYLKEKASVLSAEKSNGIKKNILAMSMHKVGSVVVFGTDNLIITKFVSLAATGLYSNYTIIVNAVTSLLTQFFTGITASVGNLLAEDSPDKQAHVYTIYNNVLFINFAIYYIAAVGIYFCINPFITIWLGKDYQLSGAIVFWIVLSFFSLGMRKTIMVFKDAGGFFWKDRYKPIAEAISNIVLSIPLTIKFGVSGTIMGTVITNIFVAGLIEAYVTYKYLLKKEVWPYVVRMLCYYSILLATIGGAFLAERIIPEDSFAVLLLRGVGCVTISITILFILFFRTEEFKYLKGLVSTLTAKIKKR